MSRSIVTGIFVALLASACGGAQQQQGTTPDCPDRAVTGAPLAFDPSILTAATSANGVSKMEIELDAAGQLAEVALYHMDESQVPEEVRSLANEKFPGHTVRQYELEQTSQGPVVEVELTTSDGRTCEVAGRPDGTFLYQECEVPVADVPAAIRQTAEGAVSGGTIREVEKREGPGGELYRIEMEAAGAVHYLVVSAGGEVQRHARVIPAEVQVLVR